MEQKLHEVSIRLTRPESFQEVAATIREEIADETLRVRTWKELMPEMFQILEVTKQSDVFLFMIIYLIMAFGLLNTQRMSALERRREFGVLIAIGVTPRRLFLVVMVETLLITLLGAILGAALGWLFSLYFVHYGLDLTLFGEMDGFQFMGVSFSNRLFFSLTPTTIAKPILYIVPFAILCGLWPAWQASKTHITNAIAGRSL
jgi:ABC-type lipoprotein release transport system permease subunit